MIELGRRDQDTDSKLQTANSATPGLRPPGDGNVRFIRAGCEAMTSRRSLLQMLPGFMLGEPAETNWLSQYSDQEILSAIQAADALAAVRRELQRIKRAAKRAKRQERRVGDEIIARGVVTEPLPTATWRDVARGTRSRTRRMAIRIADLGAPVTWAGVDLPRGTRLLVDHGVGADEVGARFEVVQPMDGVMRVHVWRCTNTSREEHPQQQPQPVVEDLGDMSAASRYFDPTYSDQLLSESIPDEDLPNVNIQRKILEDSEGLV